MQQIIIFCDFDMNGNQHIVCIYAHHYFIITVVLGSLQVLLFNTLIRRKLQEEGRTPVKALLGGESLVCLKN